MVWKFLKVLLTLSQTWPKKQFLKPSLISTLFFLKRESAFPSLWSASHINKYHHCKMYKQRKSQFTRDFDFTKAFLPLTDLMFQDSLDYEIVKQGFNFCHGEFFLHKFNVDWIIGYSIEAAQFTKHNCIFYTYRSSNGNQLNIDVCTATLWINWCKDFCCPLYEN